jgi:hypothetical protein
MRRAPLRKKTSASISSAVAHGSPLREFDRQTEVQFRQLQQRHVEELDLFDREWLINHAAHIDRANRILAVRDTAAREQIIEERGRIGRDRSAQRMALVRRQQSALTQFAESRRSERRLLRCDEQISGMTDTDQSPATQPPDESSESVDTRAPKRPRSAFLPGRSRFIRSRDVRLGKFEQRSAQVEEEKWGSLLEVESLKKALEAADRRRVRKKTEVEFVNLFRDPANVPAATLQKQKIVTVFE